MKQCDGCRQQTLYEYAWVIEGDGVYWDGHFADSRGFTRKIEDAVRFVRQEDADVVKHWLLQFAAFALRTTKHGWTNGEHDLSDCISFLDRVAIGRDRSLSEDVNPYDLPDRNPDYED
jgi:hypothetical protein